MVGCWLVKSRIEDCADRSDEAAAQSPIRRAGLRGSLWGTSEGDDVASETVGVAWLLLCSRSFVTPRRCAPVSVPVVSETVVM